MLSEKNIREQIVMIGHRLHQRGLISGYDGNISHRITENVFLITKSWSSLGFLTEEDVVKINSQGNVLEGNFRPTGEFKLHLVAYRERLDILAVVHAHPIWATVFATVGESIPGNILPEIGLIFGERIPLASFGLPGSVEISESISEYIRENDAVLMSRHGAVTVSTKGLLDAYNKMEKVEYAAQVILLSRLVGGVSPIDQPHLEKLWALRTSLGFGKR